VLSDFDFTNHNETNLTIIESMQLKGLLFYSIAYSKSI